MDCNAIGHLIKDKRSQYVNIKKSNPRKFTNNSLKK